MKWHLFITDCFGCVDDFYYHGEYYDLMALIGLLHSKAFVQITRIDYEKVNVIPFGRKVIFLIGCGEKYDYRYRIEGKI